MPELAAHATGHPVQASSRAQAAAEEPPVDNRARQLEPYRLDLTGYCYRMLGSAFDAEDAVQETMLRAWRGLDRFEGRASLRSWLHRIATNVCLNMLQSRQRRVRPVDLGPAGSADGPLGEPLPGVTWVQPIPDGRVLPAHGDPAELTEFRETVRLAFIAALQRLPARQRAVLILREVLQWKASEVAELLDTTVASVNSALQRARATLAAARVSTDAPHPPVDERQRALLARYVDAFERYDLDALTALLRKDAAWSMPPYALWLQTHEDIRRWCLGPGAACRGSRLVPTMANGSPAFGQYKPGPDGYVPWCLQVLETSGDRISAITFFLDTATLFPLFGLALRVEGSTEEEQPASASSDDELQAGEGIDRFGVGVHQPADVAEDLPRAARGEQRPGR